MMTTRGLTELLQTLKLRLRLSEVRREGSATLHTTDAAICTL